MTHDDPYEILGVPRDATSEQINAAYRKKAKTMHPDSGGGTEEFSRLKNASMVLLDPEMRKRYDETGTFEESAPNNRRAKILELIANFFITSLDAMDASYAPRIEEIDLVEAARTHFKRQITGADEHIKKNKNKAKRYETAIKRLKSKSDENVVIRMVQQRASLIDGIVKATILEREMFEEALVILKDYSFEQDKATIPPLMRPYGSTGFFTT